MKITTVMARAIKRKLARGGYRAGDIHNRPLPNSAEGIRAEMIVTAGNGTRFNVSVYQLRDGG